MEAAIFAGKYGVVGREVSGLRAGTVDIVSSVVRGDLTPVLGPVDLEVAGFYSTVRIGQATRVGVMESISGQWHLICRAEYS